MDIFSCLPSPFNKMTNGRYKPDDIKLLDCNLSGSCLQIRKNRVRKWDILLHSCISQANTLERKRSVSIFNIKISPHMSLNWISNFQSPLNVMLIIEIVTFINGEPHCSIRIKIISFKLIKSISEADIISIRGAGLYH